MGEEYKDSNGLKKVRLNPVEVNKIITTFQKRLNVEDFSVAVDFNEIKEKGYSLSAGQYFEIKIEYEDISEEEFKNRMKEYESNLTDLFNKSNDLQKKILESLKNLHFSS